MTKKFQLAIQGGGARLADLLAAVEVVQTYERKEKIKITRIAGTSAGAIAAALLSAGKVPEARTYMDKHAASIFRRLFPHTGVFLWASVMKHLARGTAICPAEKLRPVLTELFQTVMNTRAPLRFDSLSLSKELAIVTANISTREKHVYEGGGQDLIETLIDSCAIPIAFRGTKELGAKPYVDGGFCENLPSEELSKDVEKYGPIIAIAFPNVVAGTTPNSSISLFAELMWTAMNNSVQRAIRQLPTHSLLLLDSEVETFDFATAFDIKARRKDIELIAMKAEKWLDDNIAYNDKKPPIPFYPGNDGVDAIMADLFDWYSKSQAGIPRRSLAHTLEVTANSLRDQRGGDVPDLIEKWYDFCPLQEPMNCFHLEIGSSEREVLFSQPHLVEVWDPDEKPVQIRVLPTIDRSVDSSNDTLVYRGYLVLFEPALKPMRSEDVQAGKHYRLRYATELPGAMRPLVDERVDFLQLENTTLELMETVNIVLYAPKDVQLDGRTSIMRDGKQVDAGGEMSPSELRPFERKKPPNFIAKGWKTSNFGKGSEMRVDLKVR